MFLSNLIEKGFRTKMLFLHKINCFMLATFVYSSYVTGKNFIGRNADTTSLTNLLRAMENVALLGGPKTGKDSLIHNVFFNMKSKGESFTSVELSFLQFTGVESILIALCDNMIKACANTPQDYEHIVNQYFEGTHFIFDPQAFQQKGDILSLNWDIDDNDIEAAFRFPYLFASSVGQRFYVIVKEFQNIMKTDADDKLVRIFEKVISEMSPENKQYCSYIFIGSELNAMKEIFEQKRWFYRKVNVFYMSKIDENEIADAIIRGFLVTGKVADRDMLLGLCHKLKNHAWYIFHVASICDHLSKGYIMEPVLLEAFNTVLSIHEPRFVSIMSDLTLYQIRLLKAFMDGHTKFSSTEVINGYGLNSSANVKRLKDALMKKEILTFDEKDNPELIDPLFEYWLGKVYFSDRWRISL